MTWCIAGSNFDIDIEFEDDLIMGQKIKLSEKIVASLSVMECPYNLAPQQIQGLDYERIYPCLQWLIKKLMESRDTRGEANKRQGALNYNLMYGKRKFTKTANQQELDRVREIIFKNKPKRVFRSINAAQTPLEDPKRVHSALREFNDLSANKVFQNIIA